MLIGADRKWWLGIVRTAFDPKETSPLRHVATAAPHGTPNVSPKATPGRRLPVAQEELLPLIHRYL